MESLFREFLQLSSILRPGYFLSLGNGTNNFSKIRVIDSNIPMIYKIIYSNVSGTLREIKDQSLMDFIPGYRLIHFNELELEKKNLDNIINTQNSQYALLPLLANYSSDFICFSNGFDEKNKIYIILHDEQEPILIHDSAEKFLETICEFYKQKVYFLDSDGYLDYDIEKEGRIGTIINPGIGYWM